jgi:hypothetical protein
VMQEAGHRSRQVLDCHLVRRRETRELPLQYQGRQKRDVVS